MPTALMYVKDLVNDVWVPYTGSPPTSMFDTLTQNDPGAGQLAQVDLPAVDGMFYVITGIFAQLLAVNPQPRIAVRLFHTATRIWGSRFLNGVGDSGAIFITGLNVRMPDGEPVKLAWNQAPENGNFQTCSLTWRLMPVPAA